MSVEARIGAYLDGELDARAAAEVEAALVDPEIAALLSEELMLRELLASMPPDDAPEALIARLEDSLGVSVSVTERVREALTGRRTPRRAPTLGARVVRAARAGLTGAGILASGASAARLAASGASSGASVAYALGRAADVPLPRLTPPPPKPLWQRAASYLWRRGRTSR